MAATAGTMRTRFGRFGDFLNRDRHPGSDRSSFLHDPWDSENVERTRRALQALGVKGVNQSAFAPRLQEIVRQNSPSRLTPEEILGIRRNPVPALALHAIANARSNRVSQEETMRRDGERFRELYALLHGLPLVHATTYDRLAGIMREGRVLTDREYQEREKGRLQTPVERVSGRKRTGTSLADREVGLDEFVFSHFGRPHQGRDYGPVHILFKPDRLHDDPMSFATRDDFADLPVNDPGNASPERRGVLHDQYRSQILAGNDFYAHAAHTLLGDSPRSSSPRELLTRFLGGAKPHKDLEFSTWEVKTPELRTEDIDSIVFENERDLQRFRREFGHLGIRTALLKRERGDEERYPRQAQETYRLGDAERRVEKARAGFDARARGEGGSA